MPNYHKMNRKFCYVYKITNLVNGKVYIGQHRTDDMDDGYMGSGKLIVRAIEKYGMDAFSKEVLEFCSSIDEANSVESRLIEEYGSTNLERGYNICPNACGGNPLSDETKEKISKKLKGVPKPEGFADKLRKPKPKRSVEHADKIRLANKGRLWYHDPVSCEARQFKECDVVPIGWVRGRPKQHMMASQSEDANRKRAEASEGRITTEEVKAKISDSLKSWYRSKNNESIQQ